nr:retrovirus-related Pol polyprotein from transposon TNT 1-94 [Tanacetum cinerariifolium]
MFMLRKTPMIKQKENTYKKMNLPILYVLRHKKKPSLPHTTLLATDPEMCMCALTVSTTELKNIKEAMAHSAWIEVMQEELHQFDRLQESSLWIEASSKGVAKYTLKILHKHGMDKGQSIGTPMATKPKLDADLSGNPVDQTDYHSKIGSLMYLTSSRPDIVQAICFCSRYQSRPTEKYLKEVKRIFRYLRGTVNMGLWYSKGSSFQLTNFSDADHAGCIDSRKSTFGGIQFLGEKLVSWMSKKHNCTAMSSAEAEYVALSASCAQVITEYQPADMFTKALPEDRFKYLSRRIGMRCLTPAELEVLQTNFLDMFIKHRLVHILKKGRKSK